MAGRKRQWDAGLAQLITGSRHWEDRDAIDVVLRQRGADAVIHGDAAGADRIADELCHEHRYAALPMPAQWARDGKSAGPRRNREMLNVLLALRRCGWRAIVDAFPQQNSRGTYHMIDIARKAGLEVDNHGYQRRAKP